MPDKRSHRGQHPADKKLFAVSVVDDITEAVRDFSLLLTKGYAEKSALKLVGDRFSLTQRQRLAVKRNSCSDQQLEKREKREIELKDAMRQSVAIDGYNILITIEAALSKAVIFKGRDGCYKDLASMHGTYRKVNETIPAIKIIGQFLTEIKVGKVLWMLDSPVSNSGRLKTLISELAEENNWNWDVELLTNPDAELIETNLIVVSSDGVILDSCKKWVNLAAEIIKSKLASTKVIDLSGDRL
ncbi:MAG: DUF434 domain-containing protein [Planctomycetota bacterium]|jgi:hypothetical protein